MSDKLGEMLVKGGVITAAQLEAARETQRQVGGKLSVVLVKLRSVPEERLVEFLSAHMNLPKLTLRELVVSPKVSALLDVEVLEKHNVLPISRTEDALVLAASDPLDYNAIDEVRFLTGLRTDLAVAARSNIQKAIDYYCHARPCAELQEAEQVRRATSDGKGPQDSGAQSGMRQSLRVPPAKVLQGLVDLLVDKKVIAREELAARVTRTK